MSRPAEEQLINGAGLCPGGKTVSSLHQILDCSLRGVYQNGGIVTAKSFHLSARYCNGHRAVCRNG